MSNEFLLENIQDRLKLSKTDTDVAYELLIKEIGSVLNVNDAIRIHGIGTFQLRKEPLPREERKHLTSSSVTEKRTLIYTPFEKTLPKDSTKLFHVIDLDEHAVGSSEDVEKYFNLSINKPLININKYSFDYDTESKEETDTALANRVKQIITDAEVIKDFNIWDEYLNAEETEEDIFTDSVSDLIDEEINSDNEIPTGGTKDFSEDELIRGDDTSETESDESEKDETAIGEDEEKSLERDTLRESLRRTLARDFEIEKERQEKQKEEPETDQETIKPKKRDLFAELEHYLKEEESPPNFEEAEISKTSETPLPNVEPEPEPQFTRFTSESKKTKKSYSELRSGKNFSFNKWFVIVPAAVILIVIIFVLLPGESTDSNEQTPRQKQAEITQPPVTPSRQPEAENQIEQVTEKPVDNIKRTGLYREAPNDQQITNQIYYDGFKYSVQVSSWRSSTIAEREVDRLRDQGHDAYIFQVYLDSKQSTWNRVRIGYFDTQEEAQEFLDRNNF